MSERKMMDIAEWRKAVATESAPADVMLRKGYAHDIKQVEGVERSLTIVVSDGSIDRDKDILNPLGWKLENYKKAPVVLFAHDYRSPSIGKSVSLRVEDGKLISVDQFATKDEYPFADTIYRLMLGGYIKTASVGFNPMKWLFNEERGGYDFEEQEKLEHSIVPVAANPNAFIQASAKGIDLTPMKEYAVAILDGIGEAYVPKAQMETVLKLTSNGKVFSIPQYIVPELDPLQGISMSDAKGVIVPTVITSIDEPIPTKTVEPETKALVEAPAVITPDQIKQMVADAVAAATKREEKKPEVPAGLTKEQADAMIREFAKDHANSLKGTLDQFRLELTGRLPN